MKGEESTMKEKEIYFSVLLVAVSIIIVLAKLVLEEVWLIPKRIRSVLEKQGITGPKPSFPYGNISEMQRIQIQSQSHSDESPSTSLSFSDPWLHSLFPYFNKWKQHYGPIYMYSTGIKQHLYIGKPELIKELKLIKSLDLGRPTHLAKTLKALLGTGILGSNGPEWSFQRNLIAPEFFLTKVKKMVGFMEESTMTMIRTWERRIIEFQREGGKEIAEMVIDDDLKALTADVISKACFGSSYDKGNQIFAKLATMQTALAKPSVLFGFLSLRSRFLPTKANKDIGKLKEEVETLILKAINDRVVENQKGSGNQNQKDFLQVILENAATTFGNKHEEMKRFIVDNCKTIYFAGAESVSIAATWTMMLLASHPQWQQRVRSEILDTYGNIMSPNCFHDMGKFRNLKTLTMVIQESLRLYSPAVAASREALGEIKLREFVVPKGINIWLFIPELHRDAEIWGPDANEFNPERFANGVSEACKYPQVYIPFGLGSRTCLGQTFAMVQLKIIISLLLSNFSFSLSPNYRHSPVYNLLLMPKYGVKLIVSRVQNVQA
ncbi:hypothetical protein L6164_021019 [Bauhinia variegata]|uniref:Uncharacterized protein n=1 Tax=Bauhinia variegata TaxID=167791 RepID=A0ACB9MYY3_BAUVA|nr:hypothetical protein L6164_021019 [Bauhinia variegata]